MQKIDFYFDFLSPYSYFAWKSHQQKLSDYSLEWNYKPVLMGKLFSHHKFPGPGEIMPKRNYELKNCFRIAARDQIEFTPPKTFPFNPLAIIRLATNAANNGDFKLQKQIITLIFDKVWGQGQILEDPEVIEEILKNEHIPIDVFNRSFEKPAKLELKANIKECITADIFGVPTFKVNNEFFWGNDSISFLKNFLAGNDIWNKELYNEILNQR